MPTFITVEKSRCVTLVDVYTDLCAFESRCLGDSEARKVKIGIKILKSSPPPLIRLAHPKVQIRIPLSRHKVYEQP